MIIPGRTVFNRAIVQGLLSAKHQVQPCGIDVTLKRVLQWKSAGVVDFDNVHRKNAITTQIRFEPATGSKIMSASEEEDTQCRIHLDPGAYLVEFNETVSTPLDAMGQLFVRSSLFRSGALLSAGVLDSGYEGALGALLQVMNPHGLTLFRNAKLAQFVFHQLSEKVDGYSGTYQNRKAM
ncbi:deoxyuridine 5'-triphosphate nucleotidohydrolase, partial [Phlegmacium glaucopus]